MDKKDQKKQIDKVITIDNYILRQKPLGSGSFGTVYLAKNKKGEYFAAKQMEFFKVSTDDLIKKNLISELKLTHKLKHENIVRLRDLIKTKNHLYLFLEFCNGETLQSFLRNYIELFHKPLSLELLQFFVRQIVKGLSYMAAHNVIHRDLKPDNIMISMQSDTRENDKLNKLLFTDDSLFTNLTIRKSVTTNDVFGDVKIEPLYYKAEYMKDLKTFTNKVKEYTIKIIDLGLAKELSKEEQAGTICGTPVFIAPEVYFSEKRNYGKKSDLWSLGSCIYYLAFARSCMSPISYEMNLVEFIKGDVSIPNKGTPTLELIDLINGLLKVDVSKRYSWNQVINHPFIINDIDKQRPFDFEGKDEYVINMKSDKNFIEHIEIVNHLSKEEATPEEMQSVFNPLHESMVDITQEFSMKDDWTIMDLK